MAPYAHMHASVCGLSTTCSTGDGPLRLCMRPAALLHEPGSRVLSGHRVSGGSLALQEPLVWTELPHKKQPILQGPQQSSKRAIQRQAQESASSALVHEPGQLFLALAPVHLPSQHAVPRGDGHVVIMTTMVAGGILRALCIFCGLIEPVLVLDPLRRVNR